MSEERLKIAVFIDFDNIEIGVRTTLSRRFDIHAVLEAIKERGEVVTKIAYGNWKKAEDYSRALTEHAVQMVQRNLTPGGDKNGADINLALDALEMAFTRDHINAFVIVGGDSDFIALVEKLKQYDKKVFVVGGRAFTSAILQKNCHEFVAYENLIGLQSSTRKATGRVPSGSRAQLADAMGAIRRALKILTDREVSPQLGLLKSTLLQLDPTFSERDYGTGSFREFIEKLSAAGFLNLKQVDRSLIVELKDGGVSYSRSEPVYETPHELSRQAVPEAPGEPLPAPVPGPGNLAVMLELFQRARIRPRWPFYLRGLKQYLRSIDPSFDERKLGFSSFHELVRQAHRDSVLRVERNRQGILRIFAGEHFPASAQDKPVLEPAVEEVAAESLSPEADLELPTEPKSEAPAPGETAVSMEAEPPPKVPAAEEKPKRRRRTAVVTAAKRKSPAGKKPRRGRKAQNPEPEIAATD